MFDNPYNILGIKNVASREEIKKAYRDIALSCHPDKLVNIEDGPEKEAKIEKFKNATIAYNKLINDEETDNWDNINWQDILNDLFEEFDLKATIKNLADTFLKKKRVNHSVNLLVSYTEILMKIKKKLRLILVDIYEPIYIDVNCGNFPKVIKEYTDEDNVIHDIEINMQIIKQYPYENIISENGNIDLIINTEISLKDYILGCNTNIIYVDGSKISVDIPPFTKDFLEIPNKGLLGGMLYIGIIIKYIEKEQWEKIQNEDFIKLIKYFD